jgi:SNF2 family DNA or RNA helicase
MAYLAQINAPIQYHDTDQQQIDDAIRRSIIDRKTLAELSVADESWGPGKFSSSDLLNTGSANSVLEKLYPFQRTGVEFTALACRLNGGTLNACEVGLGKTLMALGGMQSLNAKRVLILAPKSVLLQWQGEINKWLSLPSLVYAGTKQQRSIMRFDLDQPQQIVITTYETLRNDIASLPRKWDLVIADEAHRLGSRTTKLYKAMNHLTPTYRIAMSATPIMNRLPELYGILNWASPGCLGTWQSFQDTYCTLNYWGAVTGARNLDHLTERLQTLMFRRTVAEVAPELPPVTYEVLPVSLSKKETDLYDKVRKELLFELQEAEVSKLESPMILQNSLVKMGKLIELCDSMELLGEDTTSSKLEALKDHLSDVTQSRKVIIFTRFSRMADILMRELRDYQPVLISGSRNAEQRAKAVDSITNDPDCRVLVSTEAGGEGLNLTTASVVYNYDLPWSVGKLIQRIGRSARIGQTKPVLVVNVVSRGTIESAVQKLLAKKVTLARDLIDTDKVITTLDQVRELLGVQKQEGSEQQ